MAAYWAMSALPYGMIGFSSTNAPAAVAPTGGCTAMFGTNPFAIAIPAGRELPVVLDLATTVVAGGRIVLHAKQDKPLAPGWAFDHRGVPTTDPQTAMKGLLAPIGGYKGYGHHAGGGFSLRHPDRLELRDPLPRLSGGQHD